MFKAEFQSFEERATPGKGAERLNALRTELARRGLDGFIVTTADQHQNEYVPACEERLAWLTGFTGSLGAAVVLTDKAALVVSVKNRTVITAVDPASMRENVFTNIDSAVIV